MELVWLQDFVALAETGNFSRAAELRHVTQPAFSRRIRSLEKWVGAQLFDRTANGCSLTAAGQRFRADAGRLVQQALFLREETRAVASREFGTLRFAVTQTLSFTFFPGWMRDFGQRTDFGEIQLNTGSLFVCQQMLERGQVHFLVGHRHRGSDAILPGDEYPSRVVGQDRLVAVSGVDERGVPFWTARDDAGKAAPYLGYSSDSGLGRILSSHAAAERLRHSRHPVVTSHLAAALVPMVRTGHGIAWLPFSLIESELKAGHLIPVLGEDEEIALEVCLFRCAAPLTPAAERFWDLFGGGDEGG